MTRIIRQRAVPEQALEWAGHPLLKRLYRARGVTAAADLDNSLSGLHDFRALSGIDRAVDRLIELLNKNGKLTIVGDFDADGATSTALMVSVLQAFGYDNVEFLVPNRFDYGYGLSAEIVAVAARQRPDVILTVDNGIASHAGVEHANSLGIDVIITDHHLPAETLPEAVAIVNPNQAGDRFPSKSLAGVGVAFYLLLALRVRLRETGWFDRQGLTEPNLAHWLDLVAVGTVADMVPLDTNNRRLVEQGLRRIRRGYCRPAIRQLLELAKRDLAGTTASDIGFALGPRLNAAGRLDDMSVGIRCLLETDEQRARSIAVELDQLNLTRREIEAGMQQDALAIVAALYPAGGDEVMPVSICVFKQDWHQGVVGLVASRLKERFHRPAIAFAAEEEGSLLKGSARSIRGIHVRDALVSVDRSNPALIAKFGGHAMAAGLSLERDNLALFTQAFVEAVEEQLAGAPLTEALLTDGALEAKYFDLDTARTLALAGPWGQAFAEPSFDGEFDVVQQRIVGERHLKLVLQAPGGPLLDAIAFGIDAQDWNQKAERVRAVYQLDLNHYRGETRLQLRLQHIEPLA